MPVNLGGPYVFLSKLVEKSVFVELKNYLMVNGLHERFQSAYKVQHSTKTALLTITNDILLSLDRKDNVFLLLLDLSAAFATVVHSLLLWHLENLSSSKLMIQSRQLGI